jgi:hypothetical protein
MSPGRGRALRLQCFPPERRADDAGDVDADDGSRVVISHAVATLAIQPPMLEIRTAIQTIRKAGTARVLQAAAAALVSWGLVSATAHPNSLMAVVLRSSNASHKNRGGS